MINPAADPTGGGTRRLAIPGAATLLLPAALGISVARAATKRLFGSTIPVQLRMSALRVVGGTALAAAALASIPVSAAATSGRAAPTQGGHSERPLTPQLLRTPRPSRRSVPERCSSTMHTRWAHEPTRSRSQTTSEPRPPGASTASPPFPSHPNSRTPTAAGSIQNADSRRSTRQPGSASTTPSTPPTHQHNEPLSRNGSRSSSMHPTH